MNLKIYKINIIDYLKEEKKFLKTKKLFLNKKIICNSNDKKRHKISEDRKNKNKDINNYYTINIKEIINYDKIIKELDNHILRIKHKTK